MGNSFAEIDHWSRQFRVSIQQDPVEGARLQKKGRHVVITYIILSRFFPEAFEDPKNLKDLAATVSARDRICLVSRRDTSLPGSAADQSPRAVAWQGWSGIRSVDHSGIYGRRQPCRGAISGK